MYKKSLVLYRNHTSLIENFVPFPVAICTIVLISPNFFEIWSAAAGYELPRERKKKQKHNELEVIIDYGFAFVTHGNEIELKKSSFPAEIPLTKSVGAANRKSQVASNTRTFLALYHRNTKIRMRSNERDE